MENKRKFQGIWIPANLWLTDMLTLQEKVFLVEINSLDNEKGCFASNKHFCELFKISDRRVTTILGKLEEKGFIKKHYVYRKGTKLIEKRVMNICSPPYPVDEKVSGEQNFTISGTNVPLGGEQTCGDNNTSNNNTKDIIGVVDYLNNKVGSRYKLTNDTKKVIKARYNEGFTYEDFTQAIDNAYAHWSKTEEYKNMKPSTLFNGKFESRVNGDAYSWVETEQPVNNPFGYSEDDIQSFNKK